MRTYIVHMTIMTENGSEPYEMIMDAHDAFEAESDAHKIATIAEGLLVATVGPVEEVYEDTV
jgi:hypothetical protein